MANGNGGGGLEAAAGKQLRFRFDELLCSFSHPVQQRAGVNQAAELADIDNAQQAGRAVRRPDSSCDVLQGIL
jgi:hypothetical protein